MPKHLDSSRSWARTHSLAIVGLLDGCWCKTTRFFAPRLCRQQRWKRRVREGLLEKPKAINSLTRSTMAAASADVGTLKAMCPHWDEATLGEVLAASGNDMDRAAESILTAGSPEAWRAARARAPPSPPAAAGAAPQGAVSVVVPPGSRGGATLSMTAHGRSFMVTVPQGLRAGDRFVATIPPPRGAAVTPSDGAQLRGKRVTLPADFLQSFSAYKSTSARGAPEL